jgi:hypothetical protein
MVRSLACRSAGSCNADQGESLHGIDARDRNSSRAITCRHTGGGERFAREPIAQRPLRRWLRTMARRSAS